MPDRAVPARLWALMLVIFSFFPIVNWVAGGHWAPWYATVTSEWISGSAIALGLGVVLFLVVRRYDWRPSGWRSVAELADRRASVTAALLALLALLTYGFVAKVLLSGRSLHIDELVQVMQARIFAEG